MRNMLKFGPTTFDAEQLSVVSFSRVRPTSLGLDVVLRLEACGCNADTFLKQHQQRLNKIIGMRQEDFFDQLYFAEYENDPEMDAEGEHSAELTSRHYIGTFLEMLIAGYDPQQHPLLEVILRQKEAALKKAKKQVHIRGCWSARGHPEPRESDADGESPLLRDNEVFLMVPCDAEDRPALCSQVDADADRICQLISQLVILSVSCCRFSAVLCRTVGSVPAAYCSCMHMFRYKPCLSRHDVNRLSELHPQFLVFFRAGDWLEGLDRPSDCQLLVGPRSLRTEVGCGKGLRSFACQV